MVTSKTNEQAFEALIEKHLLSVLLRNVKHLDRQILMLRHLQSLNIIGAFQVTLIKRLLWISVVCGPSLKQLSRKSWINLSEKTLTRSLRTPTRSRRTPFPAIFV